MSNASTNTMHNTTHSPNPEKRPISLSGAQPTGKMTLGNYLGALQQWEKLQQTHTCYYGIMDMHAITLHQKPADLRANTLSCAAQLLACGIAQNTEHAHLFVQSHVPEHAQLNWVLNCITPLGQLERMTQFKDKGKGQASVAAGLLTYPILQSADILLYNADVVPIGEDQKQHLELTRDLAGKFNHTYSDTFTVPQPYILKNSAARIMSLQEPTRKMSKSDANQNSVVYLMDEPDALNKKFKSAVTDSGTDVRAAEDKPGITNLLGIFSALSGRTIPDIEADYASATGYANFKADLAQCAVETLAPIRTRYKELIADKAQLQNILAQGAETARTPARKTLRKVYKKIGFIPAA